MPRTTRNDWHEPFLKELADSRNINKAAAAVGIKCDTAYRHRREDAAFAARWQEALKWQTAFLKKLSQSGNVTLASRSVGISRRKAYTARRDDPDFAAEWDAALWEGVETLEGMALEYAMERKSESTLRFLITNLRARLGPDPEAAAAATRPPAAAPLGLPLSYTDANGIERPVSDWQGGDA